MVHNRGMGAAAEMNPSAAPTRCWWETRKRASARQLARRLVPSLGLTAAPMVRVERAYLDTIDWRLFRRGEVLVDERGAETDRALILQSRASPRSDVRVPASRQPHHVDELPSGLRRRVGDVVAPRSLVDVGHERAEVWPLRLLDDDGKTVAYVDVERVQCDDGPDVVRVQLRAVRGYDRVAHRVKSLLDGQADLCASDDPMIVATRTSGAEPGTEPGPPRLRLDPSDSSPRAIASVLQHQLAVLTAYEDGVRRQLDPELLHDFRIAIRRTRSAVRLAKSHLSDDIVKVWESEWTWLGAVTSTPRDLDVVLVEIEEARASLSTETKSGLDELAELITARRDAAQRTLTAALTGDRYGTLKRGWQFRINQLSASALDEHPSAESLARELVAKASKQLVRRAAAVTEEAPAKAIHDLRKRIKRLRYALELFGGVLPRGPVKSAISATKRLQDDLGEFQDNEVHHELVSSLIEGTPQLSSGAIDAGRLLIRRYDERRTAARLRLDAQLRRFRGEISSRSYRRMLEAAPTPA
jgi:CHAD domain-containing protein